MSLLDEAIAESGDPEQPQWFNGLTNALEASPKAGEQSQMLTIGEFNAWLESVFKKAMEPAKEIGEIVDNGETITVYNKDGSLHAHYGPNSAKALRKYLTATP